MYVTLSLIVYNVQICSIHVYMHEHGHFCITPVMLGNATCRRAQKSALEDHLYGLLYVAATLDAVYAAPVT